LNIIQVCKATKLFSHKHDVNAVLCWLQETCLFT